MRVLVTGAYGQLGRDVVDIFREKHEVLGFGRNELDITDPNHCQQMIQEYRPDVIIHCAAYTAVDLAESEEDQAYLVNAYGTRNVAVAAEKMGCKICYISTDYVFDGSSANPYKEYDNTNPTSVYGKSKRAGENLIQTLSSKYFIVRTSWVYGQHGNNFVKTMLKISKERDKLSVVNDQIGSPTFTEDLAKFLLELVNSEKYGIYHASNSGSCSWYDFAKAIFEESNIAITVQPCTTEDFPRPAPRPKNSVMDHLSIRADGFKDLRPWREALTEFLQKYGDS
ncbi:dTDP-4-dehydrorhamnose reductase [Paenibacillus piri]|uniref:dTDP-4-dehydrorhamnose reductase n=1 Tax=Paenibacillus piri TaxID=2547395 RepID=A0A4R5KKY0_9BACL|nr:dTDP-4-dehydrorhamnose reductase [Paenibacillus piri]TDF96219.1 dTDP-4-dehydrorhamnose reductase [Paenibacillus piri]